jgi:hypothetical protein
MPHGRRLVSIDVRMLDSWKNGAPPLQGSRTTRFWLTQVHDRWVIVRRSSLLNVAMFSQSDPLADEPPATREPRADAVSIPAATFTCDDQVWATDDPLDDAHARGRPWFDIRHIALSNAPALCVTVQLAARPMPGMALEISFDTTHHDESQSGDIFAIDPDGNIFFTGSDKPAVAGVDYGMADPTTLVMHFSNLTGFHPDTVSVVARPVSKSEPLIDTQPILVSGDRSGP